MKKWVSGTLKDDKVLINNVREQNEKIYGDIEVGLEYVGLEYKRGLLALSRGGETSSIRKMIKSIVNKKPDDSTKFVAKYNRSTGQIREIVKKREV